MKGVGCWQNKMLSIGLSSGRGLKQVICISKTEEVKYILSYCSMVVLHD